MKKNVGGVDKTIRLVLGVVFVGLGALAPIGVAGRLVAFVIAAVALLTAFGGF